MTPLPIPAVPQRPESASGYMLRLLCLNGASLREAAAYCDSARLARPLVTDADLFAELTGVPVAWFDHRLPKPAIRDRRHEIGLFGFTWTSPWLLRGRHQQLCPLCIREHGFARLEWDLIAYPACHVHGVLLQDTCQACARAISPDRPALEVCSCGRFIAAPASECMAAAPTVLAWATWLSTRLLCNEDSPIGSDQQYPATQLQGLSPDGAWRLVCAFAGGDRSFRGELMSDRRSWHSSEQIARLLDLGIVALQAVEQGRYASPRVGTPSALAEQAETGVTAWDRAVAARELRRLKLGRRWRNAVPRCPLQQELFEDA